MSRLPSVCVLLLALLSAPPVSLAGDRVSWTPVGRSAGGSIYERWLHAHFVRAGSTSISAAEPAGQAALAIASLEVSSDTSLGRYRQTHPAVARYASGRHLVFWLDETAGPQKLYARIFDKALVALAPPFDLFGDALERQPTDPVCAANGSITALSWLNGEPYAIRTAFVDSFGTVLLEQTANGSVPPAFLADPAATVLSTRGFLTVWEEFRSGWRIMGQPFDSAGVGATNLFMDGAEDTLLKVSPAVAGDTSGGYLLAWSQGNESRSDILVRWFDSLHAPSGPALPITAPTAGESYMLASVAYQPTADVFHVLYIQTDLPADSTRLWLQRVARGGAPLDTALALPAGPYPWAPRAAVSGLVTVVYTERFDNLSEIRSLALDASGSVVDSTEVISTQVVRERSGVSATLAGDTLAVVWQDRVSGEYDIHGLLRAGGGTVTAESALHSEGPGGQQTAPSVTGRLGGGVQVVYTDLQASGDIAMVSVDEGGTILQRQRVSDDNLQARQYDPHIASSPTGRVFITWTDERTDWPGPAVHAAGRFGQAGSLPAAAFPLSSDVTALYRGQTGAAMHKDNSSAAVWIDDRTGTASAYMRRYDAAGTPQGPELPLTDGSLSQLLITYEQDPLVSIDSVGNIWTVWSVHDAITDSFFVISQAWSSSGVRRGSNRVVTPVSPAAEPQALSAASPGDLRLRLAWWDARLASPAVVTAVIDTAGVVQEGPFHVSTSPVTAHDPCLAVDVTGRWVVGWSQSNGTSEDLVWQRYDADGTPTAPAEQISAVTPATRRRGGALAFAGAYVYGAWYDNEMTGKGYDVRLSSLLKSSADVGSDVLLPQGFSLHPNHPNPFNGHTRIAYQIARPARVRLLVFDLLGRTVKHLADGWESPGRHALLWDGTDDHGRPVASGVYFYRLEAGSQSQSRKMLYLK